MPGINALAVEVIPPQPHDLSLYFVDWNPMPPDSDMGIVQSAYLLTTGPVSVRNPQVVSTLSPSLDRALLTLYADLTNGSGQAVQGTLTGTIGSISFSKNIQLAAHTASRISLTPPEFPQLVMANPQLWWPAGLGPQTLYQMQMQFETRGAVSDRASVEFGIRQVSSQLDQNGHRLFFINGKRILIRGAAWTHDIMLRQDPEREEYEVRYARDMHINALRLEGKMFDNHLYELADHYGVLIMPGWCVGAFEEWDLWTDEQFTIARESMRYQLRQLRNHPSVFVFLYGSDNAPPPVRRANVSASYGRGELAQSLSQFRGRPHNSRFRPERSENDRAVRLGRAQLLADRYAPRRRLGLHYGNQPRPCGPGERQPEADDGA